MKSTAIKDVMAVLGQPWPVHTLLTFALRQLDIITKKAKFTDVQQWIRAAG